MNTCVRGHPRTPENAYRHPHTGYVTCRACKRLSSKRPLTERRRGRSVGWVAANGYRYRHERLEHRAIAERALGKSLASNHPIHHVNGDPLANVSDNLVVCEDAAYHNLLHYRERALDATGDANAKRCCVCKTYERQAEIRHYLIEGKYNRYVHPDCQRAQQKATRRTRRTA